MVLSIETSWEAPAVAVTLPLVNRIRALREERAQAVPSSSAWTVTQLARRVGVSEAALRSWERGSARPHARHARALARELGVPLGELGLDEEPAAES